VQLRFVVVSAATVLALVSAWHTGPHRWHRLDQDYTAYRSYTDLQRRQAFFSGLEEDPGVFAFFKQYLVRGDRVYYQVQQSGFSSFMDLPTAVETAGRYYLLPAVQVTDLREATVVVSWLADPGLLHVRFVTQKRLGLQLMFVSRIRAP
jgi:hypothetical protein